MTVAKRSTAHSSGTRTLASSQTRERSLRSRSTIITFSARSFALPASSAARASSSAGVAPRGRVPLMGRVSTRRPSRRRKRSGDEEATTTSSSFTYAANGAGLPWARRRNRPNGVRPSGRVARKRWERFAWKTSPARIRSITRRTASS